MLNAPYLQCILGSRHARKYSSIYLPLPPPPLVTLVLLPRKVMLTPSTMYQVLSGSVPFLGENPKQSLPFAACPKQKGALFFV